MNYLKAIVAAGIAGLTAIGTALADSIISPQEWITAIIAALIALGAVYTTPPGPGLRTPPADSRRI